MNKHTPGPWATEHITGTSDKDNIYVSQDGHGELVAAVMAYGPTNPDRILRGRANALLIAAAPDLLSSLEFARDCLTELSELVENGLFDAAEDWVVNNGAVWDTIRLCIRKATGVME